MQSDVTRDRAAAGQDVSTFDIRFSTFYSRFEDETLEKEYAKYFAREQAARDPLWGFLTVTIVTIFLTRKVLDPDSDLELATAVFMAFMYLAADFMILFLIFFRRDFYLRWRSWILISVRLIRPVAFHMIIRKPHSLANRFSGFFPDAPLSQALVGICTENFLLFLAITLGYQFISKLHALLAVTIAGSSAVKHFSVTCANLSTTSQPLHDAYMGIASSISRACHILLPIGKPSDVLPPSLACFPVRVWTLVVLTIFLPMAVRNAAEERSRYQFLRYRGVLSFSKPTTHMPALAAVLLMILAGAILWTAIEFVEILVSLYLDQTCGATAY